MVKVVIRCLTYNHEPYIRKCLDGFVMQKTNFDFVAVVHDDASTDKTADIINEYAEKYPDIIKPIFETENQYHKNDGSLDRVVDDVVYSYSPDYIASCEGDDYWKDPHKLQRQVDILDSDSSLIACVTDTSIVDMSGNVLCEKRGHVIPGDKEGKYNLRDFFTEPTHKYPTASVLRRNVHRQEIEEKLLHTSNKFLGDWPAWIVFHLYGDFYYIDKPMVAYRINPTSVTHTENKIERAYAGVEICNAVADILPSEYADISKRLRRKKRELPVSLAHAYLDGKQYGRAAFQVLKAIFMCPDTLYKAFRKWIAIKKGEQVWV